jgi:hypothetical protein
MGLINLFNDHLLSGEDWSYKSTDVSQWFFPWLLSDFNDTTWLIDTKKKNKQSSINFDVFIPSTGESLASPKYERIVNTIKKSLALSRTGHLSTIDNKASYLTRAKSMVSNATSLKTLALFLIKTHGSDAVATYGFSILNRQDLLQYHIDIAVGRADKASGLTDLILNKISALEETDVLALLDINDTDMSIGCILESIGIHTTYMSDITREQIKNTLIEQYPDLVIANARKRKNTEFANCCPPKNISDSGIGKTTFESLTIAPHILKRFSFYIPELENYSCPIIEVTSTFTDAYIRPKQRTPNIPTDIALYYLNEAIKLITLYGKDIVATKSHCDQELMRLHEESPKLRRDQLLKPEINRITIPINRFTKDYKVTRYNKLETSARAKEKRSNVTVIFAYEMLCAATYILIHTFCVKRVSEIMELRSNSLKHGIWNGYEILFGIRKAAVTDGSKIITGRPVPSVVVEAFGCLVEANEHYFDHDDDPYLFLRSATTDGLGKKPANNAMSQDSMKHTLLDFADFIQLPLTRENGLQSRYYLSRTHVLRRFGAKAFYSLSDLNDFPALTWLMGHRSTEETWHYLLEEVGNEEMTEEQASAVIDALYKPNINTTQVAEQINNALEVVDATPDMARIYIHEQIALGAEFYTYKQNGEEILHMQSAPKTTSNVQHMGGNNDE